MKKILKILKVLGVGIVIVYVSSCVMFYMFQEKVIFYPEKLDPEYKFDFNEKFEEINVETDDGIILNNLLFKTESAQGVIFYLHGNAGSLKGWGKIASNYLELGYDFFIADYRGFGKSDGTITKEDELHQDVQKIYDEILRRYPEDQIIVIGYSLGTGLASKLSSIYNPKLLILKAPYYNFPDVVNYITNTSESVIFSLMGYLPTSWLLKYKLKTNEFIKNCKMPVVIFHGDDDNLIYPGSSLKLQEHFKEEDKLILLKGQGHNGINKNPEYIEALKNILVI